MSLSEQVLKEHEDERNRCLVYTRVMGYHRACDSFNTGKKGEFNQRVYFNEKHI